MSRQKLRRETLASFGRYHGLGIAHRAFDRSPPAEEVHGQADGVFACVDEIAQRLVGVGGHVDRREPLEPRDHTDRGLRLIHVVCASGAGSRPQAKLR